MLVAREICLIRAHCTASHQLHFLLSLGSFAPASKQDMRTAEYLFHHHHGLPISTPTLETSKPPQIPTNSIIMMTGGSKKFKVVKDLYPNSQVLDMGIVAKDMPDMRGFTICKYAKYFPNHQQRKCAVVKAHALFHKLFC